MSPAAAAAAADAAARALDGGASIEEAKLAGKAAASAIEDGMSPEAAAAMAGAPVPMLPRTVAPLHRGFRGLWRGLRRGDRKK